MSLNLSTRNNPVTEPLAELHLNNRLYISCLENLSREKMKKNMQVIQFLTTKLQLSMYQ